MFTTGLILAGVAVFYVGMACGYVLGSRAQITSCNCGATYSDAGPGAGRRALNWTLTHPCKIRDHPWTVQVAPPSMLCKETTGGVGTDPTVHHCGLQYDHTYGQHLCRDMHGDTLCSMTWTPQEIRGIKGGQR